MANRHAIASGNWSDPAIWDGGTVPGAGDDVWSNGFNVDIDVSSITVNSLRNDTTIGLNASNTFFYIIDDVTINADIGSDDVEYRVLYGTGLTEKTITINGNILGALAGTTNSDGVNISGIKGCTVTVNGNIRASRVSGGIPFLVNGLIHTTNNNVTINGDIVYDDPTSNNAIYEAIYINGTQVDFNFNGTITEYTGTPAANSELVEIIATNSTIVFDVGTTDIIAYKSTNASLCIFQGENQNTMSLKQKKRCSICLLAQEKMEQAVV